MKSFKYTIHSELETFQQLKEWWDTLLEETSVGNFFLTQDFFQTMYEKKLEGDLHIISFTQNNSVKGILPLYIPKKQPNTLSLLAHLDLTDYSDIITTPKHVEDCWNTFLNFFSQSKYQKLQLLSIPQASPTYRYFTDSTLHQSHTQNMLINTSQQEVCPAIELPNTFETYLASLKRKQRHEAKRKMSKLYQDHQYRIRLVRDAISQQDIKDFIFLHASSSPEKALFWTSAHTSFFTTLLTRSSTSGYLRLFFLEVEKKPIATMLIFSFGHIYYLYNAGFIAQTYTGYSPGQVLLLESIKHGIESRHTIFDFLRGNEPYKYRLGAVDQPVFDITITKH